MEIRNWKSWLQNETKPREGAPVWGVFSKLFRLQQVHEVAMGVPGWNHITCDMEEVRADDLIILSGLSFWISKIVLH